MALNRPVQPRPASALALSALMIVFIVLLWHFAGPAIGILVLLLAPFCVANVFMGGGWNDSPLDLVERLSEHRRLGWEGDK